jgi:uncharacterized membrane protein YhaH (DUF805 family)/type II secretory pathway pseudopilin PulG
MYWYLEVLKKYAVFSGRARRTEYWLFGLLSCIVWLVLVIIEGVAGIASESEHYVLAGLYDLAILIPSIAVSVRRLHDTSRSGWWLLLAFIPLVGWIVLLMFMVRDSVPVDNQYGANPKQAADASRRAASTPKIVGLISVAVVLMAVAVGMPAVQQARENARRTQSRNNLKQIGLALHKYHNVHQSFPAGTHPNEKLEADERLSWLASLLPHIEQSALQTNIDFDKAWNDESNEESANTRVPTYVNPGSGTSSGVPGETHYVGIAGLGKDGPMLPVTSNRAGVFAINRQTGIGDIRDGTSNTMMTSEATGNLGRWISGGNATIRPLTERPYINGPDGIGGPFRGGVFAGFVDGSVHFIPEGVDPAVLEHVATIAGGQ